MATAGVSRRGSEAFNAASLTRLRHRREASETALNARGASRTTRRTPEGGVGDDAHCPEVLAVDERRPEEAERVADVANDDDRLVPPRAPKWAKTEAKSPLASSVAVPLLTGVPGSPPPGVWTDGDAPSVRHQLQSEMSNPE
eukprot:4655686-Alexandrium_andersonii.AAC.2